MDAFLTREEINHYLRRLKKLEEERKRGWETHWRDLSRHFLPRRARFLDAGEETNSGEERNRLEDGIGIRALRVLANGMQSGLTSPARPWFSLTLADKDLAETADAKSWLQDTYEKMVALFAQSNFYDQVHILYSELACFGTGAVIIEKDPATTVRCRTLTVGEYVLDVGEDGRVDTLYRRIRMTPRQVVQAWPDTCPENVRDLARQDSANWLTILHAVEPNEESVRGSLKGDERPWRSVYIVLEGASREVLEDSGYYEFPALCPRWVVTGSDIYGASPAMDALNDCRQLQKLTEDGRIALEAEVLPPMLVAQGAVNGPLDLTPRALNYTSSLTQGQEVARPLTNSRANLQGLAAEKAGLKDQIQRHFHNDLFLMISDADKQMTATEVAERNEEKLLMLGPVLDRLRSELFQPLIERVYGIMDRAGLIGFPLPALAGQPVKVEFISILAQAQKQAGLAAMDQLVVRAGQLAQLLQSPEPLDKLNPDAMMENYAELLGVQPDNLADDEQTEAKRQARRQQMQMQQMLAAAPALADAADKGTRAVKNVTPQNQEQADLMANMQGVLQ
ncbi:MAG: head-tail connector protein [Desulfovibrio sp.]|jgi:hypothetical protein|nr:head-tail connector protein [Desulfovibrio sp.]